MEVLGQEQLDKPVIKPPRKPRPSEIAAKKAKAAKKKKPAAKKTKTKRKPVKKTAKCRGNNKPLVRTERMDLRLTKQEKAKIMARVKKTKGTVTGVIMEAIHKVKW